MLVEDLQDGDVRMGGSFKTAISRLANSKNFLFIIIRFFPNDTSILFVQKWTENIDLVK